MTNHHDGAAFHYFAFISYSHKDKACADWLHKALERYTVPARLIGQVTSAGVIPKRLTPIFRDREELASAHDLGSEVNEALAESANLIVICSPHSAASHWVDAEIASFHKLGRQQRIFCLIVNGEPHASDLPGREAEECFAPALRVESNAPGLSSTHMTEPIAADIRPGKDGKSSAKLKLIAGLLDVGFDALRQRELQRRVRRMTAIAAIAVLVMAVTAILAIAALISQHAAETARNEAVKASHAADIARTDAERRQKQAEDLIGFMLGDLNDKLQQVARLDIMEAVDGKATTYFASLPNRDVTDETLAQRAKALQKIGGVYMDQGKLDQALAAFQLALTINQRRLQDKPHDPDFLTDYGANLTWVGFAFWYQGKLDNAQENFSNASEALNEALRAKPDNIEIQLQLAYAYNNLGQVFAKKGQIARAQSAYASEIALFKQLKARDANNSEYAIGLGNTEGSVAGLELSQGHLAQTIDALNTQQEIFAALVAAQPNDRDSANLLAISHAVLGQALYLTGDTSGALSHIDSAVRQIDAQIKFDPTNADWQSNHAFYVVWQTQWMREAGKPIGSESGFSAALLALKQLLARSPENFSWRNIYALAQLEHARLSKELGQLEAAHEQAQAVIQTLAKPIASPTKNTIELVVASEAELLLASLESDKTRESALSTTHRIKALELIQIVAKGSSDPRKLVPWVEALLASGNTSTARPIIHKLWSMGYRTPAFIRVLAAHNIDYPGNPEFARTLNQVLHDANAPASPPARSSEPQRVANQPR